MKVEDHEPGLWFLLEEDGKYCLGVRAEVMHMNLDLSIQLSDDEYRDYHAIGREYLQYLTARICYFSKEYLSRRVDEAVDLRVEQAIAQWRERKVREYHATRASVAAGDDTDAPHTRVFSLAADAPIADIIEQIASSGYLAQVDGGATWSVMAKTSAAVQPIVVVSQNRNGVQVMKLGMDDVAEESGKVRLHFNYHGQLDAKLVAEVLERLQYWA